MIRSETIANDYELSSKLRVQKIYVDSQNHLLRKHFNNRRFNSGNQFILFGNIFSGKFNH